jgi:hypothetical protein
MHEDNKGHDLERLFSLYEVNSDNFRNIFGILVGLGLFFLLIVVLPYFLNIYEYNQSKIEANKEDKLIQQYDTKIKTLAKNVNNTQDDIRTLSRRINDTKSTMITQIKAVNNSLSDADKILTTIDDETVLVKLRAILDKTQDKRDETIRFGDKVLRSFNNSISSYVQRNDTLYQKLNSNKYNLTISISKRDIAMTDRDRSIQSISNLTERWKEIQTPFGNLPIDFTSLLAVFPIGLSAGFLLCSVWLAEAIRIRMRLHKIRGEEKEIQQDSTTSEIYIVAPLLIDPANPNQSKMMQFLLLGIPLIIFILSVILISYAWEHAPIPAFPTATDVNKYIYYILYVACSAIFAHSFWRLLREVRIYNKFIQSGNI